MMVICIQQKKIQEKIITDHQFKAEGILNVDNLQEGMFILEVEDIGEVDLAKYLKKFNESSIKLSISDKDESEAKEE